MPRTSERGKYGSINPLYVHLGGQSNISGPCGAEITCINSNGSHSSQCSERKTNLVHAALPAKEVLLIVSARGIHRLHSSLNSSKCTKKTNWLKLYNVCHYLTCALFSTPNLSLPNLNYRRCRRPHNAQKRGAVAEPRARADLYLDKQIDKQSALFHYQEEKLTSSINSGSTTTCEGEERNNMNSQFILVHTLAPASY